MVDGSLTKPHCAHSLTCAFKMAARREKGFYASLNSVSSIDMLLQAKRQRIKGRGRLWEVERLISERENNTVSGISSVVISTAVEFNSLFAARALK